MPFSGLRSLTRMQKVFVVGTSALLIVAVVLPTVFFDNPNRALGALTTVRQEVNILDGYLGAASGSYATSSEIVNIDPADYSGATYYLEVVASTTSATNATVSLVDATTGAIARSVTVNGTSYALYRSTSFTPEAATNYKVRVGNESVGKGLIAARIVILQGANPIADTMTQIEIGNRETYTSTATTTFASPKYWNYDSSKWSPAPTFYAEVTYANTVEPTGSAFASSTTYSTAGSFDYVVSPGTTETTVDAWGGGGAGFDASNNGAGGGAGGGGGAFASSTLNLTIGNSYSLVVGAGGDTSAEAGADSTFNGSTVVADGGTGGTSDTTGIGTGGTVANSTGTLENDGGNGGQGNQGGGNADQGGGGGGAGGSHGDGNVGANATSALGGNGGRGDGSSGGLGGTNVSGGNGNPGASNANGGGGGAGADNGANGGAGGAPGGGGGGGEGAHGNGADGAIRLTERGISVIAATTTIALQESDGTGDGFTGWTDKVYIVTDGTATSPTRVRSSSFTPTSGRNYRIAFKNGYTGATFAIYNAKIVADQTGTVSNLEAQYLLANTRLAAGTALQNFLTSWSDTEWSGATNVYLHQADAANGSASVIEIDTAAGVQVTGSVVTSPDNRGVSSAMTMPANGNLDTKATTNNSDVYASRILVQVAPLTDVTPPTPDPMTFSAAPTATTSAQIGMTASLATDADTPPVEYLFGYTSCGNGNDGTGGTSSSWQSGRAYSDSGLDPNKCYGYKVEARDSAPALNRTASSSLSIVYTIANTPGTPTVGTPTISTLAVTNAANGNPSSAPVTNFAIQVTATSPTDSTWLNKYIDNTGNPSGSAVWMPDSGLQATTTIGLAPNTTYTFKSMARNEDGVVTASSTGATGLTLPGTPTSLAATALNATSSSLTWTEPTNGATLYKVERCTGSGCGGFSQIGTNGSASYSDSDTLTGNTVYTYRVRANNASGDGAYSSTALATTTPDVPTSPGTSNVTGTTLTFSWTAPAGGSAETVSYKVERCTGAGCTNFAEIATPSGTSHPDSGLSPSTTYLYRVRATSVAGDGYYSSTVSVTTADTAAPTPDPMTFSSAPAADSTSQISMTASVATDATTPPVEYLFGYFACGSNDGTGGSASAWQSSTGFSDSGLSPNGCYGYKVEARDSASTPNRTASSTLATIYTLANTPGAPTLSDATETTLTLTNAENSNPSWTTFAVLITAPTDASWDGKYVDGSGNPSASEVWLSDSAIDGLIMTGLTALTTYEAQSKAKNGNDIETSLSTAGTEDTTDVLPTGRVLRLKGGTRLLGGVRLL